MASSLGRVAIFNFRCCSLLIIITISGLTIKRPSDRAPQHRCPGKGSASRWSGRTFGVSPIGRRCRTTQDTAKGSEARHTACLSCISVGSMRKKLPLLAAFIIAAVISVVAAARDLAVPDSWRTCQRDSDCSLIVRCGSCCGDDAINKGKSEDYQALYRQECKNPRPLCPCAYRKPVCKRGVCEIGR